jgi:hypothetical protein
LGVNRISFTVVDDLGNRASCESTVDVVDVSPPLVHCPPVILATESSASLDIEVPVAFNLSDFGGLASWSLEHVQVTLGQSTPYRRNSSAPFGNSVAREHRNGAVVRVSERIPLTVRAGSNSTVLVTAYDVTGQTSSCNISLHTSLSQLTQDLLSLSNASATDPAFGSRLVEVTRSASTMTTSQVNLLATAVLDLVSTSLDFSANSTANASTVFHVLDSVSLVPGDSLRATPGRDPAAILRDAILQFAFAIVSERALGATSTEPAQVVRWQKSLVLVVSLELLVV